MRWDLGCKWCTLVECPRCPYFGVSWLEGFHRSCCTLSACVPLQITIVSFLVSDSIPFTTVELLQIEPTDMSVDGARDKVQIVGKKQGAKGPVSLVTSSIPFQIHIHTSILSYSHSHSFPFSHTPVPILWYLYSHSSMFTFPFVHIPIPSSTLNLTW